MLRHLLVKFIDVYGLHKVSITDVIKVLIVTQSYFCRTRMYIYIWDQQEAYIPTQDYACCRRSRLEDYCTCIQCSVMSLWMPPSEQTGTEMRWKVNLATEKRSAPLLWLLAHHQRCQNTHTAAHMNNHAHTCTNTCIHTHSRRTLITYWERTCHY